MGTKKKQAEVAELVDAHDSKSCLARGEGSIPSFGTSEQSNWGEEQANCLACVRGIAPQEYLHFYSRFTP